MTTGSGLAILGILAAVAVTAVFAGPGAVYVATPATLTTLFVAMK